LAIKDYCFFDINISSFLFLLLHKFYLMKLSEGEMYIMKTNSNCKKEFFLPYQQKELNISEVIDIEAENNHLHLFNSVGALSLKKIKFSLLCVKILQKTLYKKFAKTDFIIYLEYGSANDVTLRFHQQLNDFMYIDVNSDKFSKKEVVKFKNSIAYILFSSKKTGDGSVSCSS